MVTSGLMAALTGPHPSLSFEFFPPKDSAGAARLAEHAASLQDLSPDFLSVTYGAGGSSIEARQRSVAASKLLGQQTGAPMVAHLALSGHTMIELEQVIDQFLANNVAGFMALRGDPPGGPAARWINYPDGITYANQLVDLIRRRSDLPIGVAAFPFGHPAALNLTADTAALAAKRAAGADFAVTQVLFEAGPYQRLRDRVAAANLDLPLVPGIMPITATTKISKLELFHGAPLPDRLLAQLQAAAGDAIATERIGLKWAVGLAKELLAAGAPGVHFYTLNSSVATTRICAELGLRGHPFGSAKADAG